jgi:hypothetical protein
VQLPNEITQKIYRYVNRLQFQKRTMYMWNKVHQHHFRNATP